MTFISEYHKKLIDINFICFMFRRYTVVCFPLSGI